MSTECEIVLWNKFSSYKTSDLVILEIKLNLGDHSYFRFHLKAIFNFFIINSVLIIYEKPKGSVNRAPEPGQELDNPAGGKGGGAL